MRGECVEYPGRPHGWVSRGDWHAAAAPWHADAAAVGDFADATRRLISFFERECALFAAVADDAAGADAAADDTAADADVVAPEDIPLALADGDADADACVGPADLLPARPPPHDDDERERLGPSEPFDHELQPQCCGVGTDW